MDPVVAEKLTALTALVQDARPVPMTGQVRLDRREALALLHDLGQALPGAFAESQRVLRERDVVVDEGREQARRLRDEAVHDQDRLISSSEVVRMAEAEAAAIRAAARDESAVMRGQVDTYVDARLGSLEQVLDRALATVRTGRDRVRTDAATPPHAPGGTAADDELGEAAPTR